MAPRRTTRLIKSINNVNYSNLSASDVVCPICQGILIEPVTLPCNHGFCVACFEGTMANTNLVCPICRIRIGSWLRSHRKEKTLINTEYWKAINDLFPQQVKNKLAGVEENIIEELPIIKLSKQGEIRQEYELQKKKEDEEFRRKREEEIKASEELIQKLTDEEQFELSVREEKVKFDEEVAKKLAEDLTLNKPSTSKIVPKVFADKKGPLDRYLKSTKESVPLNIVKNDKPVNRDISTFATKEYTCRVLSLGSEKNLPNKKPFTSFSELSAIKKKFQQIQKLVDTEFSSDSSDVIEPECRYFKPIDYRSIPPSEKKHYPVRVPTRKPIRNSAAKIIPPSGQILHSNFLESAFARIPLPYSSITYSNISKYDKTHHQSVTCTITSKNNSLIDLTPMKRRNEDYNYYDGNKKQKTAKRSCIVPTKRTSRELFANLNMEDSCSPPFYGFHSRETSNNAKQNDLKQNHSIFSQNKDSEKAKRILQEKSDLEFARKLQEELNRSSQYPTRSRIRPRNSIRQVTLDEIITNTYKVK